MDGNTLRFEYVFFRVNIYYVIRVDTSERYDIEDYEPIGDVVYLSEEKANEICDNLNDELRKWEQSQYEARASAYDLKRINYEKAIAAGVTGIYEPHAPSGPYVPDIKYRVETVTVVE